jgi:hypothetical protein
MPTKEQWQGLENSLKSGRPISFKHNDFKIKIVRARISETKLAYAVFLNDEIPRCWLKEGDEGFKEKELIYCRKSMFKPYAKYIREVSKERGGKSWLKRKENAYLHETRERYYPYFSTAKSVISHFRKLEGITLIAPDEMVLEESYDFTC